MRALGLVTAAVVALTSSLTAPAPAHADGHGPASVRLQSVQRAPDGGSVELGYRVRCPFEARAFVGATITQVTGAGVVQRPNFTEIDCTGEEQQVSVTVTAAAAAPFGRGAALVDTGVDAGLDIPLWRAREIARARLDGSREPQRLQHDALEGNPATGDTREGADLAAVEARRLAKGAGLAVTYEARCPEQHWATLVPVATYGGRAELRTRGYRDFYCAGDPQRLKVVVLASAAGAFGDERVALRTVLSNDCFEFGCFRAEDSSRLRPV